MKRSYVLASALACFLLGAAVSQLFTRRVEAQQGGQAGRYQLFQGRYGVSAETAIEVNGVFRIDTVTGKTDGYYSGKNKSGTYVEGWSPIPQ